MKLPKSINIIKSANEKSEYLGQINITELDKLKSYLHDVEANNELFIHVSAKQDLQYRYIISLEVKGDLPLTCQRCLEEFTFSIDKKLELIALNSIDNISNREGDFEPVILDDSGRVNLYEIISDEVILSIPHVPKHAVENCGEVSDVIVFEAAYN